MADSLDNCIQAIGLCTAHASRDRASLERIEEEVRWEDLWALGGFTSLDCIRSVCEELCAAPPGSDGICKRRRLYHSDHGVHIAVHVFREKMSS